MRRSDSGTTRNCRLRVEVFASTVVVDDAVLDDQLFFCERMEVAFRSQVCASKGRGVA